MVAKWPEMVWKWSQNGLIYGERERERETLRNNKQSSQCAKFPQIKRIVLNSMALQEANSGIEGGGLVLWCKSREERK